MQSKATHSSRQNLLSLFDQVIVSGANFLLVLICARNLSPAEQGKIGYVIAANFAVVMIGLTTVFQFAAIEFVSKKEPDRYHKSLAVYQLTIAVVASALVTLLISLLAISANWKMTALEVGLLLFFLILQQLADFDRRASYIFFTVDRALISSSCLYSFRLGMLLVLTPKNVTEVLLILLISCVAPALFSLRHAIAGIKGSYQVIEFFKEQLRKSRWLIFSGPLSWLWGNSITFFAGTIIGLPAVAILVALRSITNIANIGLEVLETRGAVSLATLDQSDRPRYFSSVRQILKLAFLLWIIGLLAILFFGEIAVQYLYGDYYGPYWHLMVWLWFMNLGIFIFKMGSISLRIRRRTFEVFLSYGVGVIAAFVMIPVGAYLFDLSGAVVAMTLSAAVLCGAILYYQAETLG